MEKEQRILFAKRVLANFKATLVLSNEHFLICSEPLTMYGMNVDRPPILVRE